MRLELDRVEVSAGDVAAGAAVTGDGTVGAGPLSIGVTRTDRGVRWSVANRGDEPVRVRSVAHVWSVVDDHGPLRFFRHGYQSWSESSVAVFGRDTDPSLADRALSLSRGMHHADAQRAIPGELRSELVTVLADGGPAVLLAGFDGGHAHDGTFRLRPTAGGGAELWAEAFLGGAELAPGERRPLHGVVLDEGADPSALLERWAGDVGRLAGARTAEPYQVGWCSWYHYFHGVTEVDIRANLARAGEWPFEVFQIDDGYQAAIGDWLTTAPTFPSPLDRTAADIATAGLRPGIWLAPFLASPDSDVARAHPDWLAGWPTGGSLVGMVNEGWGGLALTLDTTNPEVLDHLERTAAALVDAGYTYLKLDFTYAPALGGVFADPSRTPAERVRAGYDAVRRGAGDDAFLLACGCPLGAVIGAVDGMRIGADVAPWWELQRDQPHLPGYDRTEPATANAWRNTLTRSAFHRRLWLNDPDCVMLRTTATRMDPDAVRAWALAVGVSGGMALVSDDLALLDGSARALLDEVLALGRASDDEAKAGRPPRCTDLLDSPDPTTIAGGGAVLTADPEHPVADLRAG
jgi:alpha-galactosidase